MTQAVAPLHPDQTNGPTTFADRLRAVMAGHGVWALGDQAVLSLGNFLTNLAIYRRFSKTASGDYYIVLSFILFLNNLHMALVTYPLSITVGTVTDAEFRRRTGRAVAFTVLGSIICSALIAWPTARIGGWTLVPWVVSALILWQLQETLRRAMMGRLEYRRAIPGDAISYLGQAALAWALIGRDSPVYWAFALIAITSGAAIVIQLAQFMEVEPDSPPVARPAPEAAAAAPRIHFNPMYLNPGARSWDAQLNEHWTFGKWVLLSNLANVFTLYATPWVIGYFQGTAVVAMFSTLILLLNASNPVCFSVANLITPAVAKAKAEKNLSAGRKSAALYALQGAALLLPFYGILLIAPGFALHLLYGDHSPYLTLTSQLRVFVLVYACMYASIMVTSYLCGLGKSRGQFFGQATNAVITCLVTLPLAAKFGVTGAAWGGLLPVVAQLLVSLYYLRVVDTAETKGIQTPSQTMTMPV